MARPIRPGGGGGYGPGPSAGASGRGGKKMIPNPDGRGVKKPQPKRAAKEITKADDFFGASSKSRGAAGSVARRMASASPSNSPRKPSVPLKPSGNKSVQAVAKKQQAKKKK